MHRAKKSLGQNFLKDQGVIDRIVRAIAPQQSEKIIEIGPGLGALTRAILPLVGEMDVVEIDSDVIAPLQQTCAGLGKLIVHHEDALQYDFSRHAGSYRVIGNLPYNISSPLLFHLLSFVSSITDMHFMLQKEVVDRMAAKPNTADYGRLSVMLQYHCQAEALFDVPPYAFYPVPRVESAVVRLIPHRPLLHVATDYAEFEKLVKLAFSQRRKTLRNCLKTMCQKDDFEVANIDPQQRAEVLAVEDFVRLANVYVARIKC